MAGSAILKCGCSQTVDEFTNKVIQVSFCERHSNEVVQQEMKKVILGRTEKPETTDKEL